MEKDFRSKETSWLSFNARVLQEAADPEVPLYERIKFLGIYSSNLDEFFRVRVATLKRLASLGDQWKELSIPNPNVRPCSRDWRRWLKSSVQISVNTFTVTIVVNGRSRR